LQTADKVTLKTHLILVVIFKRNDKAWALYLDLCGNKIERSSLREPCPQIIDNSMSYAIDFCQEISNVGKSLFTDIDEKVAIFFK